MSKLRSISVSALAWCVASLVLLPVASLGEEQRFVFVTEPETATSIAAAIIKGKIGSRRFERLEKVYLLKAQLEGDVWSCYFYPRRPTTGRKLVNGIVEITIDTAGGTPVLKISKTDARVIDFYYSK